MLRVILSRKGFDSSYGGYPSPILPDGTLMSLPIPSPGDKIRYSELRYDDELSYFDIMKQLKPKIKTPNNGFYKLTKKSECHLDPDLIHKLIAREKDWRPLFGQINQAQSHLENQMIGKNDLFLFFGWFRETEFKNGKLQFKKAAPDLHVIHGYLQVAEIIQPKGRKCIPEWMKYHPHLTRESRLEKESNTLYVARSNLSWNNNLPGGSALKFDEQLVLTKDGETRSVWDLPKFMKNLEITYHSNKSWNEDGSFNSAKIGQEFVITENKKVEKWASSIISDNI